MISAFRNFFNMFASLFTAGEKAANSLVILASVGEAMANDFKDDQDFERAKKAAARKKELAALKAA